MRSPEFTLDKPPGALRLLFLGDSITYGTTLVNQDDIFVELVRKDLSMTLHRRVEEINASASGWAISNEYGFLHSRGTYNSDYVLLVLNSGDLDQPFSSFSDVAGGQTTSPRTAIGELLTRVLQLVKQSSQHDAGTTVQNDPNTERANLRELTSMANFTRGQGSGLLLVFVPIRQVIARGVATSVPNALGDWARSEGVDILDLTRAVSSYETKAITLRDGIHYNPRGNRLLADLLEKYLADKFTKNVRTDGTRFGALEPGSKTATNDRLLHRSFAFQE
jgi:lysophospholipase L1-like esterase